MQYSAHPFPDGRKTAENFVTFARKSQWISMGLPWRMSEWACVCVCIRIPSFYTDRKLLIGNILFHLQWFVQDWLYEFQFSNERKREREKEKWLEEWGQRQISYQSLNWLYRHPTFVPFSRQTSSITVRSRVFEMEWEEGKVGRVIHDKFMGPWKRLANQFSI